MDRTRRPQWHGHRAISLVDNYQNCHHTSTHQRRLRRHIGTNSGALAGRAWRRASLYGSAIWEDSGILDSEARMRKIQSSSDQRIVPEVAGGHPVHRFSYFSFDTRLPTGDTAVLAISSSSTCRCRERDCRWTVHKEGSTWVTIIVQVHCATIILCTRLLILRGS
jgi:hypothetical protein